MEYKVESSLWDFPAWSGGKDTLDILKEKNDVDAVEAWIDGMGLEDATDTTINDILWFERDMIAEALGYRDWEAYEEGWSEDDLSDAEEWFEGLDMHDLQGVSGLYVDDYDDEESFVDAANEWWDDLDDAKKVEIYYQND
ncbi:MAG: hypothetical protein J6T35_02040 [Bacteroidales bacterium]|nr:hypothetical protein [Bacteroidales bacterium]